MSDIHDLVVVAQTATSNSPYADVLCVRAPAGTEFPALGDWFDHGRTGRVRTVDFVPSSDGHLCHLLKDGAPSREGEGFVVAAQMIGHHAVTCLYVRQGAQFVVYLGYKLRREAHLLIEGPGKARYLKPEEVAPPVVEEDEKSPPPMSSALAEALMRAGIARKEGAM